jgi:hypothetical protein
MVKRVTTSINDISIPDEIIDRLASKNDRRIRQVMLADKVPLNLVSSGRYSYYTMRIRNLALRCPFKMVRDVMVPILNSETAPIISLNWIMPPDMKSFLLFQTWFNSDSYWITLDKVWLLTFSTDNLCWRLPLGNLYDDSAVCTGIEIYSRPTAQECISDCLSQFSNSVWNSDLWKDTEYTQRMFRFFPTNDGFKQAPIEAPLWTSLCRKIAIAVTTKLYE